MAHHVVPKLSFESLFVELGLLAVPEQFIVDQAALADTNSLVHRHPALLTRVRRRCSATFGKIFGLGHILGLDKDKNSALVLRAGVDHGAAQRGWGNVVNTYASGINFPGADHTVSYYERLPLANGKYIEYCTAVVSMPYHNDYRLEKFERAKKVAGRVGWKVSEHHSWSWHMAGATDLMLFQPATSVAETKKLWDGSFKRWLVENKTRLTRSARPYRRHCIQDAIECQHIPLDVETFEQFEQRYLHEYIPAYEYGSRHGAGPIFRDLFNKWRKETGGSDIRE